MACCTSRTPLAKQATTSRTPLANHVLLAPTIPLLVVCPRLLASRVSATLTLQQALPLVLLRVQAARLFRLDLRVHVELATTPRAARVSFVLRAV